LRLPKKEGARLKSPNQEKTKGSRRVNVKRYRETTALGRLEGKRNRKEVPNKKRAKKKKNQTPEKKKKTKKKPQKNNSMGLTYHR